MSELLDKLLDEMEDNIQKMERKLFPPGIRNFFISNRNRRLKAIKLQIYIMRENKRITDVLRADRKLNKVA